MKKIFLALLLWVFSASAQAADPVDALLIYPQSIRNQMIEALKYPKVLLGLFDLQQRGTESFKTFYQPLAKDVQKEVLILAAFPNLVHSLAVLGEKNPAAIEALLKGFPTEAHAPAKNLLAKHPDLLTKLDQIDNAPEQEYKSLIDALPMSGKGAYFQLLRHGEILKFLTEALDINAGNVAKLKSNPQSLDPKILALSQKLAAAANPSEPKLASAPGDDPKAMAQLQKSADQMNRTLDYEMQVDPKPAGAAEASVSFTPYPFYNPYTNRWMTPYWFGGWNWW